jgi:hypothetical protein
LSRRGSRAISGVTPNPTFVSTASVFSRTASQSSIAACCREKRSEYGRSGRSAAADLRAMAPNHGEGILAVTKA